MVKSMTGFGSSERVVVPLGKVSVELRSTNHKFLETVLHAPPGFLSLEDKIKKLVESKVKRGRVTCAVTIVGGTQSGVVINKQLVDQYVRSLRGLARRHALQGGLSLDTLVRLPGVISLAEQAGTGIGAWPQMKSVVSAALDKLVEMRAREGKALQGYLRQMCCQLSRRLGRIKDRCAVVVKEKSLLLSNPDERSSFIKSTDITEELDRLSFHGSNLASKLNSASAVGKEMDFIAQEMQREANTMGAKSCDAAISAWVVEVKSYVEKIREQVQNIE